ncbi:MAG: hypothetical protein H7328_10445 [Bdellovibrio sp.]|nr:hypothetical protein [Bdellovibrio sp.]
MNRFLKIALISLLSLGGLIIIVAVVIFMRLPSASSIGQAFMKKAKPGAAAVVSAAKVLETNDSDHNISGDFTDSVSDDDTKHKRSPEEKAAMTDDLINPQQMSNVCSSLKNARTGMYKTNSEIDQAFAGSILSDKADPRIQAMKPFLRYMFQLPKMNELVRDAEAAAARGEDSLADKALFYSKIYSALMEVQSRSKDLEAILDRSYLFLGLNNLVALKPELANDSRVQNYCSTIEIAFNQKRAVAYDEERADFLNFLNDVDVHAADINFDPTYKTEINFEIGTDNIGLQGRSWLNEIFKGADQPDDPVAR